MRVTYLYLLLDIFAIFSNRYIHILAEKPQWTYFNMTIATQRKMEPVANAVNDKKCCHHISL